MKQAAIIVRVSTVTQNYERQIQDMLKLAKAQGYTVSEKHIYAEKISGTANRTDRGELNRLIADIKAGDKIQMVFAQEVSRIARSPDTSTEFIKDLMKLKVGCYISNMNMGSRNPDGSANNIFFLILGILSHFAAAELEYISSRMKSGKKLAFKDGRNLGGGMMVYGYMLAEKDDEKKAAKLIINPDEAPVVKKIFKMTAEGAGQKAIANYLNSKDIPTRAGKKWQSGSIAQLLQKEIYFGNRSYNVYGKNEDGEKVLVSTERYEGIVPAIITKAEYVAANNASKKRNVNPVRNTKYLYLLTGKVRCGYCGNLYSPKFRAGKQSHYGCSSKINNKKEGVHCPSAGIGIDKLESLAWRMHNDVGDLHEYLNKYDSVVIETKQDIKNLELELQSFLSEQSKKNIEKDRVLSQHVKGYIDDSKLAIEMKRIQTTFKNLDDKVKKTEQMIKSKNEWIQNHAAINTYSKVIGDIGTDRVKINDVLSKLMKKMIITSVGGSNTEWFIVTTYIDEAVKGRFNNEYKTVLFNKKTLKFYMNGQGQILTRYKDGLSNFKPEKIKAKFLLPKINMEKAKAGTIEYEKEEAYGFDVKLIPFTRLNTLDGLKPVATKVIPRKKQYRKKKGV